MPWIESHTEIADHPKTRKLLALTRKDLPTVVGYLHLGWWWAAEYSPDGRISKYPPDVLASAVCWHGSPDAYVAHLVESGFAEVREDGETWFHDWSDYAQHYIDRVREQNRARQAKHRTKAQSRDITLPSQSVTLREETVTLQSEHVTLSQNGVTSPERDTESVTLLSRDVTLSTGPTGPTGPTGHDLPDASVTQTAAMAAPTVVAPQAPRKGPLVVYKLDEAPPEPSAAPPVPAQSSTDVPPPVPSAQVPERPYRDPRLHAQQLRDNAAYRERWCRLPDRESGKGETDEAAP